MSISFADSLSITNFKAFNYIPELSTVFSRERDFRNYQMLANYTDEQQSKKCWRQQLFLFKGK